MSQEGTQETSTIADLMKMMIEDQREREEEIAHERERSDREMEARVQEIARQMEVMKSLVKESQKEPEESVAGFGSEQTVKLTKLSESDDVEAYLTTFERMMEVYQVDKRKWAYLLAPELKGKMQQAYAAMPSKRQGSMRT